ncbi:MAG: HPF/RaiA family ribosome-associated protein [Microthrixaceae bacterium]
MTKHEPVDQATIDKCLIVGHGFHHKDQRKVSEVLARIDHRLTGLEANQVSLEISVKDRDHNDQKVTLEADIGRAHLVASDESEDLWGAVAAVREEILRQYNDWSDTHRR